ncbi:probable transposase [Streptomyces azureus]|uniref:Probable transposase n=1 Tax=Streptomyces azureus TaxID=146537 RepID=A0A0K8PD78_STRAJ|nr:probable transposase [Streptomyces azureus]
MRLQPHLPKSGQRDGRWEGHRRRVINGILFRQRTGMPWRDLPARFGKWKTVYERHRRWSADGTWDKIFAAVLADADAEGRIDWSMVSVDSTTCRTHQHAAAPRRKSPRVPGKGARPGSTALVRDSDAPGVASPARSIWWGKAGDAPLPC